MPHLVQITEGQFPTNKASSVLHKIYFLPKNGGIDLEELTACSPGQCNVGTSGVLSWGTFSKWLSLSFLIYSLGLFPRKWHLLWQWRHQDPCLTWLYGMPHTVSGMLHPSVHPPMKPLRWGPLLSSPLYRWGDLGRECYRICSRSHSGGAETQVQVVWCPCSYPAFCLFVFLFPFLLPITPFPFVLLYHLSFLLLNIFFKVMDCFNLLHGLTCHFINSPNNILAPQLPMQLKPTSHYLNGMAFSKRTSDHSFVQNLVLSPDIFFPCLLGYLQLPSLNSLFSTLTL